MEAKKAIVKKTKWSQVLMDDDLVEPVAKYLKWAKEVYDHRPLDIEPRELEQGLQPWQQELIDHLAKPVVTKRSFGCGVRPTTLASPPLSTTSRPAGMIFWRVPSSTTTCYRPMTTTALCGLTS